MRRVVVTGMGMVTPLGAGVEHNWSRITNSDSGIVSIKTFETEDLGAKIAGFVPTKDVDNGASCEVSGIFDPDKAMAPKEQRKVGKFIVFGMGAADEAVEDSGWTPKTEEEKCRTGVLIGSGIGGFEEIAHATITMRDKSPRRITPFFIPSALINLASGQVSIKYGFKGPNHAVVTACSTGAHAIGDAARMIMLDDADVMVAGGAESAVNRLGMAGFCAARALSTGYNDRPTEASRPWDQGRDGFVMGEGSAVLVLEELEHAKKRGANILAELVGYGRTCDAYHITAPEETGAGASRSMELALKDANLKPEDINYINAHGTSTKLNDKVETLAVKNVFGDHAYKTPMSSTKSMTGHLLGAAGGIEFAACVLAIRDGIIPPTINLDTPDPDCDLDYVPNEARKLDVTTCMSNSLGFGGHNATVICKKYQD